MDLESLREYCLSFANATEDIQWGDDLLFRVGGKIFAVLDLGEALPPYTHRSAIARKAYWAVIDRIETSPSTRARGAPRNPST